MTNMGDALRRAGLISPEEAARAGKAASQRGRRRPDDSDPPRPLDAAARRRVAAAASRDEILALFREHALKEGGRPERRYHFEDDKGRLPFLPVSASTARRLRDGALGIGTDGKRFYLLPREIVLRALDVAPDLMLCFHGDRSGKEPPSHPAPRTS